MRALIQRTTGAEVRLSWMTSVSGTARCAAWAGAMEDCAAAQVPEVMAVSAAWQWKATFPSMPRGMRSWRWRRVGMPAAMISPRRPAAVQSCQAVCRKVR